MSKSLALLVICAFGWALGGCGPQEPQHQAEGLPMNESIGEPANQDIGQQSAPQPGAEPGGEPPPVDPNP